MAYLNRLQLLGTLIESPTYSTTPTGKKVAKFTVVTRRQWTTDSGEPKEIREYHAVEAWERAAEALEKSYPRKDDLIMIEASVSYKKHEDAVGKRHTLFKINLTGFQLLSRARPENLDPRYVGG